MFSHFSHTHDFTFQESEYNCGYGQLFDGYIRQCVEAALCGMSEAHPKTTTASSVDRRCQYQPEGASLSKGACLQNYYKCSYGQVLRCRYRVTFRNRNVLQIKCAGAQVRKREF